MCEFVGKRKYRLGTRCFETWRILECLAEFNKKLDGLFKPLFSFAGIFPIVRCKLLIMKTRTLALVSFGVPFVLGGGFIGLGTLLDQLQHPDDMPSAIYLSSLWYTVSSGTIFGLISLALVFLVVAIFRVLKKYFAGAFFDDFHVSADIIDVCLSCTGVITANKSIGSLDWIAGVPESLHGCFDCILM